MLCTHVGSIVRPTATLYCARAARSRAAPRARRKFRPESFGGCCFSNSNRSALLAGFTPRIVAASDDPIPPLPPGPPRVGSLDQGDDLVGRGMKGDRVRRVWIRRLIIVRVARPHAPASGRGGARAAASRSLSFLLLRLPLMPPVPARRRAGAPRPARSRRPARAASRRSWRFSISRKCASVPR